MTILSLFTPPSPFNNHINRRIKTQQLKLECHFSMISFKPMFRIGHVAHRMTIVCRPPSKEEPINGCGLVREVYATVDHFAAKLLATTITDCFLEHAEGVACRSTTPTKGMVPVVRSWPMLWEHLRQNHLMWLAQKFLELIPVGEVFPKKCPLECGACQLTIKIAISPDATNLISVLKPHVDYTKRTRRFKCVAERLDLPTPNPTPPHPTQKIPIVRGRFQGASALPSTQVIRILPNVRDFGTGDLEANLGAIRPKSLMLKR